MINEAKIRLKSDLNINENGFAPVILQPTDYFSSICTNELTMTEVSSRASQGERIYDGFSLMSKDKIILDLSESLCSNHIGISSYCVYQ